MHQPNLPLAAAAVAVALAVTACAAPADETESTSASSSPPSPSPSATDSAPFEPPSPAPTKTEPAGPELEVTVDGDDISPNAEELDLETGEKLLIAFDSDRAGELHVHSKPEQYVQFESGRSEQELVIETPGTVEIEEHDSGAVVAVVGVQ